MIIDVHNHFYPVPYIEELAKSSSLYKVTYDDVGNPVLHSPGDYNVIVPDHRSIEVRKKILEQHGIDKQIISLTCPGTYMETPEKSAELSNLVNSYFHDICQENPEHFDAWATLPLNNPEASVQELERVRTTLGFKGAMLFSNVNGIPLSDERFFPLYDMANKYGMIFYIHPTYPVGVEAMKEFMLMPLLGFTFDTTLAAASLVYRGILEDFPNIKWILGHLGGTIPYLSERLDRGYEAFPECRKYIQKPPGHYLRQFYFDTVNFDLRALQYSIDYLGVDHLLAGSDYPHMIGSIEKMKESLSSLNLSGFEKRKIISGNILNLMESVS